MFLVFIQINLFKEHKQQEREKREKAMDKYNKNKQKMNRVTNFRPIPILSVIQKVITNNVRNLLLF